MIRENTSPRHVPNKIYEVNDIPYTMNGKRVEGAARWVIEGKEVPNLSSLSNEINFETIYPDLKFCGDNAAMIAWAGIQRFKKNMIDDITVSAKSRWPLDKNAPYMKGPGLKL